MENVLRWGFFLIGAFIVFLIFYDVWFRRGNRFSIKPEISYGDTLSEKNTLNEPFFESNVEHRILEPKLGPFIESDTHDVNIKNNFSEDFDSWYKTEDPLHSVELTPSAVPPIPVSAEEDIIIISVLAKPPEQFASYDLLQSISATGMQYGAMDIFHYYYPTDQGYITLFSLASATKPGKFDLDHMGDFSCLGLTLFMNKTAVPNPKQAFLIMLEKAQQLADDLHGDLRAGPERIPWNEEIEKNYLNQLL